MTVHPKMTDFDSLPPLVPKGGDREAILEELVSKWATPIDSMDSPHTLRDISLIDERVNKPISFEYILQMVIDRLKSNKIDMSGIHVYLDNCYIHECDVSNILIPFNLAVNDCIFFCYANFCFTKFNGEARFVFNQFIERVNFRSAIFANGASFYYTNFKGTADFSMARFDNWVDFDMTYFSYKAEFTFTTFDGSAHFNGLANIKSLDFDSANFKDCVVRAHHAFHSAILWTDSRDSATFGRRLPKKLLPRLWHKFYIAGNTKLNWGSVRGFGELAILTRASTSGLVLVPILAALWPGVRAMVEYYTKKNGHESFLPPVMPEVWGMLFFAALCAMLGRVIYQASCPEEVRERSRVDVINDEMDAFRSTRDKEGDRRLDEAISSIEEAGTHDYLRWFRHPNLVSHRGRTVWIPSKIEDFEYDRDQVPQEWTDEFNKKCDENPGQEFIEPELAEAVMSKASREDITIQAGAGAWYDIISRQNRKQARIALWCYTLAVVLVCIVIWDQAIAILQEMGLHQLTDELARRYTLWLLGLLAFLLVFGPIIFSTVAKLCRKLVAMFIDDDD